VLQPYSTSHVIHVEPWTRQDTVLVPGECSDNQNLLAELIKDQCTGKPLVVRERDDHICFIAFGRSGEIKSKLAGPSGLLKFTVNVTSRVQTPAQLTGLLFEDRLIASNTCRSGKGSSRAWTN
jgi:hypothetical protein